MKRKFITLFLILLLLNSTVFASVEFWVGSGLFAHTDIIPPENKNYYQNIDTEIEKVIMIGPSIDLTLFPYYEIPIGLKFSNIFLFPIGYDSGYYYQSMQGDMKIRTIISIDYAQMYTSQFGLFAGFGFEYDTFRFSKTNIANTTIKPDYYRFDNYGITGELGLLTTIEKGYFKFGFNYYQSLVNSASSHDWIFAGGYRF